MGLTIVAGELEIGHARTRQITYWPCYLYTNKRVKYLGLDHDPKHDSSIDHVHSSNDIGFFITNLL